MKFQHISTAALVSLVVACSSEAELGGPSETEGAKGATGDFAPPEAKGAINLEEGPSLSEELGASQGNGCAASETLCDGIDDDCNGQIDDVDLGADGFCDCLRIGVFGGPGHYESDSFQNWIEARGSSFQRTLETQEHQGLGELNLSEYDVILLDWVKGDYDGGDAKKLEQFVAEGGGVLSMTGYANNYVDAGVHNDLLSELGTGYDLDGRYFDSPTQEFFDHPLSQGGDLVAFWGGLEVLGPEHADVFARGERGQDVGLAFAKRFCVAGPPR